MKVSKKSLIVSIAVLCVCALSLSAASFAWFTTSESAKVDTLNMSVTERSSLELTITGSNIGWKTTLTPAMFAQADYFYLNGESTTILNDVSTNDMGSWVVGTYDEDNNNFDFTNGGKKAGKGEQEASWLEMPISFRSSAAGTVTLNEINFTVDNTKLNPALRVGVVNGTTKTIYGNATKGYYQPVAADSEMFATRQDLTTTYKALADLKNYTIALSSTPDADGYYTAQVTFYVWIEGSDDACINKNTPAGVTAGVQFGQIEA